MGMDIDSLCNVMDRLCEPNEAAWDRALRIVLAVASVYAFTLWIVPDPYNYLFLVVSVFMLFTAATGHCLAYDLIGISTAAKKPEDAKPAGGEAASGGKAQEKP